MADQNGTSTPSNGNGNGAAPAPAAAANAALALPVNARKRELLISSRAIPGAMQPMSADSLQTALGSIAGVKVVKVLKPQGLNALSTGGIGSLTADIVVAETTLEQANALRASAPPNLIIEHNALLKHADDGLIGMQIMRNAVEANLVASGGPSLNLQFNVTTETGNPVPKATVIVYGRAFPAQAETDANGQAVVQVYGGPIDSIQAIYVKPAKDFWEKFVQRPELFSDRINIVQLTPLAKTFPNFPTAGIAGWGDKVMGLDGLGQQATGKGIKIGIIDSGCDNTHPQLTHVTSGVDFTNNQDAVTWNQDLLSHGTHCAGVIGGRSDVVQGIRGIAPEAEVHALKVFPGGRFDSLISAIDECITRGIDVINMSLGSDQGSELVTRKLAEARQNGIACIVAAGNSGGPVQFPGNVPGVLTVSAIGKAGEFPADTNHAQTAVAGTVSDAGIFPAKFSCFGPEVGVCAPGVAIVSTVPGGYAAWDGTSMAAPHITGLAALLLAHHPSLQQAMPKNDQRVTMLFQLIRAMAVPVVADSQRGGAGLPMNRSQQQATSPDPRPPVATAPAQQAQIPLGGNPNGGPIPPEAAAYFAANQLYYEWLMRMQAAGLIRM